MKKTAFFQMPHVNKKFRSITEFFSHLNFSLSRKQRYEQKTTLFSLHSSFCSATKSLVFHLFFTCLKSCFKIHSNKIDLKKDFSNTPLRFVKRQRPNTIQIFWIVKKPISPQYSPTQLTASQP